MTKTTKTSTAKSKTTKKSTKPKDDVLNLDDIQKAIKSSTTKITALIKTTSSTLLEKENTENHDTENAIEQSNTNNNLSLSLSESLYKKLKLSANDEGVKIEELAKELISEGLVLRAFEIIERKNTMRTGNSRSTPPQYQNRNNNNNNNNNNRRPNNSHNRNNNRRQNQHNGNSHNYNSRSFHSNPANMMLDNPSFMEYLRNQESH